VGRHTAPDGDAVHPVIAAALARRQAGARAQGGEGPLGWPAEPPAPGSGGLGWPGDLPPAAPAEPVRQSVHDGGAAPAAQGGRRRGWRRLLGLDRAA
jgi:hypothetical protein